MTEANKNRYSYKYFRDWIFPKFHEIDLTSLSHEFETKYKQNKQVLDDTMGSGYLLKLQYIILPKLIRQNGHKLSNYRDDMWHVWIVTTWSLWHLTQLQCAKNGVWYWKIDWDDDEYGNSNAYINSNDNGSY